MVSPRDAAGTASCNTTPAALKLFTELEPGQI